MTDFVRQLPAPRNLVEQKQYDSVAGSFSVSVVKGGEGGKIPVYGTRSSWIPAKECDFSDGGSYPECHVIQYPMSMGRECLMRSRIVALESNENNQLAYDAILHAANKDGKILHTKVSNQISERGVGGTYPRPVRDDVEKTYLDTKKAIDEIIDKRMNAKKIQKTETKEAEYFRYTPSQQAPGHNSNCAQRVIKMVEAAVDPLEPPKFRVKKIPAGPPSPPPPVQCSPPRKLTRADQLAWKIPPCISNWKNQKGYTIPLDKRLQADGRNLLEVQVNENFSALSESLYVAERAAREEIRIRNELQKQKAAKEELEREEELRRLAEQARAERIKILEEQKAAEDPDIIREKLIIEQERKRDVEREVRLERVGKKKRDRDIGRDISERVALGQAPPTSQAQLYDSRLFSQTSGLTSGFDNADELYDIYDKPLFAQKSGGNLYRFEKDRMAQSLGSESIPSFSGADQNRERTAPVEFEKDTQDPFGLDTLLNQAKKNI